MVGWVSVCMCDGGGTDVCVCRGTGICMYVRMCKDTADVYVLVCRRTVTSISFFNPI